MKTKKMILLMLLLVFTAFSIQAQTQRVRTVEKNYPFNPDYPDVYWGDSKVFLELVHYTKQVDVAKYGVPYVINFSGMTTKKDGSKKYIMSNWGFDTLEEFVYYKNLIENKKYYRILLKEPNNSQLSEILVLMNPRRKIPKI